MKLNEGLAGEQDGSWLVIYVLAVIIDMIILYKVNIISG